MAGGGCDACLVGAGVGKTPLTRVSPSPPASCLATASACPRDSEPVERLRQNPTVGPARLCPARVSLEAPRSSGASALVDPGEVVGPWDRTACQSPLGLRRVGRPWRACGPPESRTRLQTWHACSEGGTAVAPWLSASSGPWGRGWGALPRTAPPGQSMATKIWMVGSMVTDCPESRTARGQVQTAWAWGVTLGAPTSLVDSGHWVGMGAERGMGLCTSRFPVPVVGIGWGWAETRAAAQRSSARGRAGGAMQGLGTRSWAWTRGSRTLRPPLRAPCPRS